METLLQDARFGARLLKKNPGVTAVAVLSLAFGIGLSSTIFSVISALFLRPLPYRHIDRLVYIGETHPERRRALPATATANLIDWREQNTVFDQIEALILPEPRTLVGSDGLPERLGYQPVTLGFFGLLGLRAVVGRLFMEGDDKYWDQHGGPLVIFSHSFWQRRFAGDPGVLDEKLNISGYPATVAGVLEPGFRFFSWSRDVHYWGTISVDGWSNNRRDRILFAVARLKPGVTSEQAQAEMNVIAKRLETAYPETNKDWGVQVTPLQEAIGQPYKSAVYPLFGAVVFLLLMGCTNVASLLLARASKRQKEMALRVSLGAGRFRIIRQLLTESLLLGIVGGVLGLFLAYWGVDLFVMLGPSGGPQGVTVDGRVLGFTLIISLLSSLVFGLVPAWQLSKTPLNESLKESARGSGGKARHCTLGSLVVAQVSLALVLLTGAGLMINSFLRLLNVELGFERENLLTMALNPGGEPHFERINKPDQPPRSRANPSLEQFYSRVLEAMASSPGVRSVGMIDYPAPIGYSYPFTIVGQPVPAEKELLKAEYNSVNEDFFEALRIPLIRGRGLQRTDAKNSPWVAVIDERMAREFWPNENPLGQVITFDTGEEERPREIVGVVGEVKYPGLWSKRPPKVYISYRQQTDVVPVGHFGRHYKNFLVRADADASGLVNGLRAGVAKITDTISLYEIKTMNEVLDNMLSFPRFITVLLAIFAGVALLLAAVGIYGVISYSTSERTNEIGIRMALGAEKKDILRMVLWRGGLLAIIGLVIGLGGAFAATRVLAGFLFGVGPQDPLTFAVVALVLLSIALLATYIPARRAAKVDPVEALRYE